MSTEKLKHASLNPEPFQIRKDPVQIGVFMQSCNCGIQFADYLSWAAAGKHVKQCPIRTLSAEAREPPPFLVCLAQRACPHSWGPGAQLAVGSVRSDLWLCLGPEMISFRRGGGPWEAQSSWPELRLASSGSSSALRNDPGQCHRRAGAVLSGLM